MEISDIHSREQRFDAIVIGGRPAGLSAAMALSRACRTVAVFDSQEYRNENATMMQNVLGHDGESPKLYRVSVLQAIMKKQYGHVVFVDAKVVGIQHITSGNRPFFQVKDRKGKSWSGLRLVLVSGLKDILPSVEGYKELWGQGM